MNLPQELERLAKLHASGALSDKEFAQAKQRVMADTHPGRTPTRSVRRESKQQFLGWPLWAIAVGPDHERGERRGHARAIFAVGDIATGVFAFGGFARGVVACGGLAIGVVAFGGAAIGILLAVGGGVIGCIAMGGGALGVVAIGGGACGYFALGGGAGGAHAISASHQDPEAIQFFQRFFFWLVKVNP